MSTVVEELLGLVESMPAERVDWVLDEARKISRGSAGARRPSFAGSIQGGPRDGSTPDGISRVLAQGFGRSS